MLLFIICKRLPVLHIDQLRRGGEKVREMQMKREAERKTDRQIEKERERLLSVLLSYLWFLI